MFPFLQLVFQAGDWQALLTNRTVGATLYGASSFERQTVLLGKMTHYFLLYALPLMMHGPGAMFAGAASYVATQVGAGWGWGRG